MTRRSITPRESPAVYWVEQGIWSDRDSAWGFRYWSSHTEKKEAIREAKSLGHGRVLEVRVIWEDQR